MSNDTSRSSPPDAVSAEPSAALAEALERHRAFWLQTETDRPLMRVKPAEKTEPAETPWVCRDGTILADGDEIRPGTIDHRATLAGRKDHDILDGDFITCRGAYGLCWTEAVLGCRIKRVSDSVWAEPFIHDWDEVDKLCWDDTSAWLDELLAINRLMIAEAGQTYPVCQPHIRGPLDMVAAAVPGEMLYTGFYDHPAELHRLLHICADIFIGIAERWFAETPPFCGGYWGYLWGPGKTVRLQEDAMRSFSPRMYRDFVVEIDRRIASQFEYVIMEVHSGAAHILPVLVEEPELDAIAVALDPPPAGPSLAQMLPSFEMVQQAGKSLFVHAEITQSELDAILETLSPVGLAVELVSE
jgi:hypothetical protein